MKYRIHISIFIKVPGVHGLLKFLCTTDTTRRMIMAPPAELEPQKIRNLRNEYFYERVNARISARRGLERTAGK
jgi:hypothetical protein